MLIRIVRMTFNPEKIQDFKSLFDEVKPRIQNSPRCIHVEHYVLIRQNQMCFILIANVFYTYSKWKDEEALEAYRTSDFFEATWKRTKVLFEEKTEAYSLLSLT